jgi:hypothetical protein
MTNHHRSHTYQNTNTKEKKKKRREVRQQKREKTNPSLQEEIMNESRNMGYGHQIFPVMERPQN